MDSSMYEDLEFLLDQCKWNLENPGNEDDTLETAVEILERILGH